MSNRVSLSSRDVSLLRLLSRTPATTSLLARASVTFDGGSHAYSATINYISTQSEFTPPVIYNRENRAKLVYMIEAKFSPADAAELRPGQPVDVKLGQ